jgi:hypothetical protein
LAKEQYNKRLYEKMNSSNCSGKFYWHIAKEIFGNKVKSGIPTIFDQDVAYSTASAKANLFNEYFAEKSNFTLPPGHSLPPFNPITNASLDKIQVTEDDVLDTIKQLDISKANGPDNVSNRMIRDTGPAIAKPLAKLFNKSLELGKFPTCWKEANVSPVHKKSHRQTKTNYRPISLLSNLGKLFERIVFKVLYAYCKMHGLLTWRNSGYKPFDSTVNQLINIVHIIYEALDKGQDVCFISLDASSAFDRVWHEGLIFKLKQFGISGKLLDWFTSYLSERKQRVVINGQNSTWKYINAGVPQGSILGPILFLIYINDIVTDIESGIFLFADDTCILQAITDIDLTFSMMNRDLDRLNNWANKWLVTFNPTKTEALIISKKTLRPMYPDLFLDGIKVKEVETHCHLGLTFTNKMNWDVHIDNICEKASKKELTF